MKRKITERAVVDSRLHVNNLYRYRKPQFSQLPNVAQLLSADGKLDFDDPVALRTLTTDLLQQDFDIELKMPENHLIPTVTSRLNYLLWVHDLIHPQCSVGHFAPACESDGGDEYSQQSGSDYYVYRKQEPDVLGIDIGTGASAIYPLLGHRVFQWQFLATDIDPVSLRAAHVNISANDMDAHIKLKLNDDPAKILLGVVDAEQHYAFCMCNPPFYEREDHASEKLTATKYEKATAGGELQFIERLVDDSCSLKTNVDWFTSLVGKKVHLKQLKRKLVECNVLQVRTTEIAQGRMSRWAIGWSFVIPPPELHRAVVRRRLALADPQETIGAIASMIHKLGFDVESGASGLSVEGLLLNHAGGADQVLLNFRIELQYLTQGQYLLDMNFVKGDESLYSATEEMVVSKLQEMVL